MARSQPKSPLAELVGDRMAELKISRVELMKRLGYANPSKGLRRFDEFMATGQSTSHLLKTLPELLGLANIDVEDAAAITRQQIADTEEAAAREQFRPHILVLASWPDGKRFPFFIQAFAYGQKVLHMADGFDKLSSARQVRQVARIVRQHFRENGGKLGVWGTITGYRLQITYDHSVVLNTDGTIREGFNRDQEPPPPMLTIKGKRIPVGVFGVG